MTTSPVLLPAHRNRPLTRSQERRMLARALRRRDRARRVDVITYRYRHAIGILAATGTTVIAATVGHVLYVLLSR